MQVPVWAFTALSVVCAEDLYSSESMAGEPSIATQVAVDAAGQITGNPLKKMGKAAAKKILLSVFDTNKDQCIDQAEYANAVILNPLAALDRVEGPEAWALAALQNRKLDASTVAPYKWCPFKKKT